MTGIVFQMPPNVESVLDASALFDKFPDAFSVNQAPWKDFPYKPDVKVKCAWQPQGIFLKYYVREDCVRAVYSKPNEPVYKDSCVEFFVSPPEAKGYYNFEINPIGNILAAFGSSRNDRKFLPEAIIKNIAVMSSLGREPFQERIGTVKWEITAFIPVDVIAKHMSGLQKGCILRANFYKCGDELSKPHYLCWAEIDTPIPDFHRPEYFGDLVLAD